MYHLNVTQKKVLHKHLNYLLWSYGRTLDASQDTRCTSSRTRKRIARDVYRKRQAVELILEDIKLKKVLEDREPLNDIRYVKL